jgi:hypothetical protein
MEKLVQLECCCCGNATFLGWQHPDRDIGYGVCAACEHYYGYNTEGVKPDEGDI